MKRMEMNKAAGAMDTCKKCYEHFKENNKKMPFDLLSKMFFADLQPLSCMLSFQFGLSGALTIKHCKKNRQIHNCHVFTSKKNQSRHIRSLIAKIQYKTKNYVLLVRETQHV